jgi:signal transduction histidine kinase
MPNTTLTIESERAFFKEIIKNGEKGQILVAITTSIFQFIWYSAAFLFLKDYLVLLFFGHLIILLIPLALIVTRHKTGVRANVINFVALSLMSMLCLFAVSIAPSEHLEIFVFGAVIILFGPGAVGLWSIRYAVIYVLGSLAYHFTLYLFIGNLTWSDYILKCLLPMSAAGVAGIMVLRMRLSGFLKEMEMSSFLKKSKIDLENQKNKLKAELDFLIYSISHDLRSPILSVKGLLMLVKDYEKLNPELNGYLKMANNSVDRLDQTIFDILDFADNARFIVKQEQFNIREMVQEIFDDLKFLTKVPISFFIEIEGSDLIFGDRKRLKTVIKNLASNAVKYCSKEAKNPFVKFSLCKHQDKIEFSVEDNGSGIPAEHQQKIFEMFYRYATHISGSGLGLFIVKEVLTKIGGSIALESEFGKGSKFVVSVPQHLTKEVEKKSLEKV